MLKIRSERALIGKIRMPVWKIKSEYDFGTEVGEFSKMDSGKIN